MQLFGFVVIALPLLAGLGTAAPANKDALVLPATPSQPLCPQPTVCPSSDVSESAQSVIDALNILTDISQSLQTPAKQLSVTSFSVITVRYDTLHLLYTPILKLS